MAIRETVAINDGMSRPLEKIQRVLDKVNKRFEQLQKLTETAVDTSAFDKAETRIERYKRELEESKARQEALNTSISQ